LKCCSTFPSHGRLCAARPIKRRTSASHESHDSNLQPPILEDGAANSIQYHWGDGEALHIGHFSKWQALTSACRVTVFGVVSESLGSKLGPSLPPVPRRIHKLPKDQQTDRTAFKRKMIESTPIPLADRADEYRPRSAQLESVTRQTERPWVREPVIAEVCWVSSRFLSPSSSSLNKQQVQCRSG